MAEYICREAIIDDLEKEIEAGNVALDEDVWINKGLRIAIRDIKDSKSIDVQPVNQWISCKDKMPEHGVTVLIYTGNHTISLAWYDKDMEYFYICDSDYKYNPLDVTHWRPLPEPPKKEG